MESESFAILGEAPGWCATLDKRFKLIEIALSDSQSKLYLLEQQDPHLDVLRNEIAALHSIIEDMSFDDSEGEESVGHCDYGAEFEVIVNGESLATRTCLGR